MQASHSALSIYTLALVVILLVYILLYMRRNRKSENLRNVAIQEGLHEPPSLHPVIDPSRCLGSISCVSACPEGDILGIIRGKAELVSPANCIGHGACAAACPHDAIKLVFGTRTRGVELPVTDAGFESSVSGIFIAGELGGMGLIRNAIVQGQQAIQSIIDRGYTKKNARYDVIIVGAGPAGLSAGLMAQEKSLSYLLLEQESPGGTIAHYPRGKIVMTSPVKLPVFGKLKFSEASKEELMQTWQQVIDSTKLRITLDSRVESIIRSGEIFTVKTNTGEYDCAAVLLAMGRRGTPRKLDVPGEELPKVVYNLVDPEQYRGQDVLVVGGGDSALEAALSLAEQGSASVTLSYRGSAFSRAKPGNRQRIEDAIRSKMVRVLLNSNVLGITDQSVTLALEGDEISLQNDAVIINAGGILPTGFLKSLGIDISTHYGSANH